MRRIHALPKLALILWTSIAATLIAQPIQLHPDNPRWFQWDEKAIALITSAEHYGAVLNLDFDYETYLETLAADGLNYTRIFSGAYVEPQGAFGIKSNTLAPKPDRFIAPWIRSETNDGSQNATGYTFDLDRFDPAYLSRLKSFLSTAAKNGVIVELTFFCSTYTDEQWAVNPLNPANNLQAHPIEDWKTLHTTEAPAELIAVQEKLVRWLVNELNGYDNLFYEIQNEPWADNNTVGSKINPYANDSANWRNAPQITTPRSIDWQRRIATLIAKEEAQLPNKHLIAQNVTNFRLQITESDLAPEASIINFHYAYPEAVTWNKGQKRVIGYDETGFAGTADSTYRQQAWNFIMSGGGLYNNLDYSFAVGHEDGSKTGNSAPGGGSPVLRKQLKTLSAFLHSVDLSTLHPDSDFVSAAPGCIVRALSYPGKHYLAYLETRPGATLQVKLPKGKWRATWTDPLTGTQISVITLRSKNGTVEIAIPKSKPELALKIVQSK